MGGESLLVISWKHDRRVKTRQATDETPTMHGVENGEIRRLSARFPSGLSAPTARDLPDPGPGVATMRRTLKRDIAQLLAQRRKEKINGLCVAEEQWNTFSKPNPAPVPSVAILQHPQDEQPALCGHRAARVTPPRRPAPDKRRAERPRDPSRSSPARPSDLSDCLLSGYPYASRCCRRGSSLSADPHASSAHRSL